MIQYIIVNEVECIAEWEQPTGAQLRLYEMFRMFQIVSKGLIY